MIMKVALVHDFLTQYGGAERVLETFCEMFPEAPIYTLLYDKDKMGGRFSDREIITSYLQKFPKFLRKRYQWLLLFMPQAPETFDLRDFDLVISSSGAWSKGVVTRLDTTHVSYTHSPMRFAWDWSANYVKEQRRGRIITFFMRIILNYLRIWDFQAADRVDYFIANSRYTQSRIKKYYRKDSQVIYPPLDNKFLNNSDSPSPSQNYFLVVARLSPYKGVDIIIEAFNKLELPLVVVGSGKKRNTTALKKIAGPKIKFTGFVSDEKLIEYYKNAKALIVGSVEDFGLTTLEAMSQGTPVIAYREGGSVEIVEEGVSGEFFDHLSPEVLAEAVRRFSEKEKSYDRSAIKAKAREFSEEKFKREIGEFLEKVLKK